MVEIYIINLNIYIYIFKVSLSWNKDTCIYIYTYINQSFIISLKENKRSILNEAKFFSSLSEPYCKDLRDFGFLIFYFVHTFGRGRSLDMMLLE